MRRIEMTDETWSRLLLLRDGQTPARLPEGPAMDLYGPIAAARGGFVLAQVGQSLDGRVATPSGDARDISCPEAIAHLHRCRALVDALVIGCGTVRADNPRLSVRAVPGPSPVRVVVDCRAELTGEERLFHDGGAPVIVLQGEEAPRRRCPGAEMVRLPVRACGLDPRDIRAALRERGLRRILVEGGARTIARFLNYGLVDRLHVAVAPLIIGAGPSGFALKPVERLSSALRPKTELYALGGDILFDCRFEPASGRQGENVKVADEA